MLNILKLVILADKWGSTAVRDRQRVLGLFPPAEYQLPPFSMAIRGCLAVPGTAHQVCCVCSRPYTDCGQLIKEASHRPSSPYVSVTASISFTSSHISPSLFPDPFFYLSFVIRPSNWPFSCLKAVFPHIFPVVFFFYVLWSVVLVWGYTLRFFWELDAPCSCSRAYLTRPSERWTNKMRHQWWVPGLVGYI